jgi:GxxExxY protein
MSKLVFTAEDAENAEVMNLPLNELTYELNGAAIEVHRELGPGLLESSYEAAYAHELTLRGIPFVRQKPVAIIYKGIEIECGYRLDILADERVVVELKSVETILPIHEAQLLTYLKLSGLCVGLLMNFNTRVMKDGIRRFVNRLDDLSANSAISAV